MSATLSLRIETRRDELLRLDAAVESLAEAEGWPPDLVFPVKLALEELCINILNYGHEDGQSHEIEIELTSSADMLAIEITDDGRPFDPLTDAPPPDLDSALEDRTPGGLGIHFVHNMMDEVRYRRVQDRNHLTLIKRRDE